MKKTTAATLINAIIILTPIGNGYLKKLRIKEKESETKKQEEMVDAATEYIAHLIKKV